MRTWPAVALATLLGCVVVALLRVPGLDPTVQLVVSDGGQLLAAVAAAAGCLAAARSSRAQRRAAWGWLAAGCLSWATGQTVWSFYEVVLHREAPFPSPADVGFLLFPVLAGVGLVRWLGTQHDQLVARSRDVLDGAILAGSLLVVSWVTTLGSVLQSDTSSWAPFVLSLSYPAGDLVLATLVLLALARAGSAERATLLALALGLGALATADSAYVYLVGTGAYTSADLTAGGWVLGFGWVAAAGVGAAAQAGTSTGPVDLLRAGTRRSLLQVLLPYLALLVATGALGASLVTGGSDTASGLVLVLALVVVVVARQLLELLDNQRLLTALAQAHDALETQTLHDSLTGLANRTLFAGRLEEALGRPGAEVSVLFCDLDDLKVVNDTHGHEVGDALLTEVAARMVACVSDSDTVARLSGDEFAVLLAGGDDAETVASRVVGAVAEPMIALGRRLDPTISIGVARHPARAPDDRIGRRDLLQRADEAMYAAKLAGKGQVVVAPDVAHGRRHDDAPARERVLSDPA